MASRIDKYESKSDAQSIEDLSNKLTADLRRHIRALGPFPVLSDQWCSMADSLGRIANITEMEQKLPKSNEDATLWECEELALRYILEDGKLNLCLRNLVEFKEYEKTKLSADADKTSLVFMDKFEKGLGVVLKNAWLHVEALQTTDLPLLINYVADVLKDAVDNHENLKGKPFGKKQEAIVIHYLSGLCRRLDDIGESRIMPLFMEREMFKLLAYHLNLNSKLLTEEDISVACKALAMICETEDFQTHKDGYINTDEDRFCILAVRDEIVEPRTTDYDMRRQLRPFLDFAAKCERACGRK